MSQDLAHQWALLKPQIIDLLEEGWSKSVVFKRLGITPTGVIYNDYYLKDKAFKERLKRYNKGTGIGVYTVLLENKETKH